MPLIGNPPPTHPPERSLDDGPTGMAVSAMPLIGCLAASTLHHQLRPSGLRGTETQIIIKAQHIIDQPQHRHTLKQTLASHWQHKFLRPQTKLNSHPSCQLASVRRGTKKDGKIYYLRNINPYSLIWDEVTQTRNCDVGYLQGSNVTL